MKVYLSGPITGTEGFEIDFEEAELIVESDFGSKVETVVNPVLTGKRLKLKYRNESVTVEPNVPSWSDYMKVSIQNLLNCDTIAMLPEWQNSKGACLEKTIADKLGFRVVLLSKKQFLKGRHSR